MEEFKGKETILWDFDGVILDSMSIRGEGFKEVLSDYSKQQVEELLKYHRKNGGLSRYVKFRYFITEILGETLDEGTVQGFAQSYSKLMRRELISKKRIITSVLDFIKRNQGFFKMHIVSGSDGEELRFLCDKLGISQYFESIEGSPTPKTELVSKILIKYAYNKEKTCLIGDSINDYDAANANHIEFYGYNNKDLKKRNLFYIESF